MDDLRAITVTVLATLVKARTIELGYDPDNLPKELNIQDDVMEWLVNKYSAAKGIDLKWPKA